MNMVCEGDVTAFLLSLKTVLLRFLVEAVTLSPVYEGGLKEGNKPATVESAGTYAAPNSVGHRVGLQAHPINRPPDRPRVIARHPTNLKIGWIARG